MFHTTVLKRPYTPPLPPTCNYIPQTPFRGTRLTGGYSPSNLTNLPLPPCDMPPYSTNPSQTGRRQPIAVPHPVTPTPAPPFDHTSTAAHKMSTPPPPLPDMSLSIPQHFFRGTRLTDGYSPSSSSARSTGFPSPAKSAKSEGGFRGRGRMGLGSKSNSTPRRPTMRRSASVSFKEGGSEPPPWRGSGSAGGSWKGSLAGSSRKLFRGGPTVGNWMNVVSGRAGGGGGTGDMKASVRAVYTGGLDVL